MRDETKPSKEREVKARGEPEAGRQPKARGEPEAKGEPKARGEPETGRQPKARGEPETEGESEGRRRRKRLIVMVVAVIVALGVVFALHQLGVFRFPWEQPSPIVAGDLFPGQGEAKDGHLSNMSPDEIRAQMQKAADASYFSFKINARPEFASGSAAGDLGIENPSYNVYPMVVQIFRDDTGELIYDSGGIQPNQHIDTAHLLVVLPKGSYEATAYLNAYDPDTKEWQGKQAAALVITVQN